MPVNSFDDYPMSWKPVLHKGKEPLGLTLSRQLEEDIRSGKLLPGTKLPPQRELADYLDINLSTVARAFKVCSEKGLLLGNIGRGTYVAYDVLTRVSATPTPREQGMIELGVMMPETVRQEEIHTLLSEIMTESDFGRYFQYSIHVDAWQRQAAQALLQSCGISVPLEQICFSNGAQNALAAIFAGILKAGDSIGVDPLVYQGLKSIASMFSVRLVPVRQENGEMSEEGLRYAIQNHNIRGIYIMPDTGNPTTHIMTAATRDMIAGVARKHQLIVIEDSMDRLIQPELPDTVYSRCPEQTFFVLSLSKAVNPSLRLAYTAVPEQYQKDMEGALYNLNLSLSSLLLEIASRLIVTKKIFDVIAGRRRAIRERNRLVNEILRGFQADGNEYNLGRWLHLPESLSGAEFERRCLDRNVNVYGAEHFSVGRQKPVHSARLSISSPDSVEKLREGLEIIRKVLEE